MRDSGDPQKQLSMAYAHVISSLMGNFTLITFYYGEFSYERKYQFTLNWLVLTNTKELNESLVVQNTLSSFHFVSCGDQGTEILLFSEFILIFDKYIWILILISIILAAVCLAKQFNGRNIFSSRHLLYFTKVFFEQGDPFPETFQKLTRFRLVIAGILLAGLVLSNAYKSNNVYNIVTPRQVVPYSEFDELVRDNFSIYSKMDFVIYNLRSLYDLEFGLSRVKNITNVYSDDGVIVEADHKYFALTRTETTTIARIRNIRKTTEKSADKNLNTLKKIILKSRPHPRSHELLVSPLISLITLEKASLPKFQTIIKDPEENYDEFVWKRWNIALTNYFYGKQDEFIHDDLTNCSKSVWILQKYQANKFARHLRKNGLHSDVGMEAYTNSNFAFRFWGLVPPFVLKRISVIHSTGLFEWWQKFIDSDKLRLSHEKPVPVKPNMSGNISVIFVLWSNGVGVALFMYAVEAHGNTLGWFKGLFIKSKFIIVKFKCCAFEIREKMRNFVSFAQGLRLKGLSIKM